jgi:hypothetical protein
VSELTPEELQEAQQIKDEIDQIALDIEQDGRTLDTSWVKLGARVHKVRSKKYWKTYGARSFGSYVMSLEPKIKRKRSQVYVVVGVVETLGSQISEEVLEKMGVSRAYELKKYAVKSGKLVPQELIDSALDREKDIDQLRAEVATELHEEIPDKGSWYDLGGFFVSDDEKLVLDDTIQMTKAIDPPIAHDIPEWQQTKEVLLRWAMEFRSTYQEVE